MRFAIVFLTCCAAAAQTNAVVAVSVQVSSPSITIPSGFLGLSFETSSLTTATGFPAENAQFQLMVSQLGAGWLRFGGNSVDKTAWLGGTRTSSTPANSLTQTDVDRVAAFARATGWRVLWALPLANSTATADASEAGYVTASAGDVLSGLEIGNEPDLYASNGYTPNTISGYLTAWGQYAAAIDAVSPKAQLTGPAAAGNISTWTAPFANEYGSQITLLTQHFYPLAPLTVVASTAPNAATIPNLLGVTAHSGAVSEALALNSIALQSKIPWRMAETNSCYNGGQTGVSDVFASTLWGIDYMMALAGSGAAGVNFHGGGAGTYTPIAVNGSTVSARPLYYALLFFGAAAQGRVLPVSVGAGNINLTAYGTLAADGTVHVIVINKDLGIGRDGADQSARRLRIRQRHRAAPQRPFAHRKDQHHTGRKFRGRRRNVVAVAVRNRQQQGRLLQCQRAGRRCGGDRARQPETRNRQYRQRRIAGSAQ